MGCGDRIQALLFAGQPKWNLPATVNTPLRFEKPGSSVVGLRHRRPFMTAVSPPLSADLDAGLRRLRLSAIRVLVEAEIASRDLSNARARMKTAAFPVTKTLEEFDVAASSVKRSTFDYLASLEWVRATENLCLVGPAGTGKSHLLVALGHHAVASGHRVSATSQPPTSSKPSTGLWPTTRSARSSCRS